LIATSPKPAFELSRDLSNLIFSPVSAGGPKGIKPDFAGLETVMSNHGAKNICDPKSAFGITAGNPIWEEMRDIALRIGPNFLLNVTQNEWREITGVFVGHLLKTHKVGIYFDRASAMQKLKCPSIWWWRRTAAIRSILIIFRAVKA
jgi:nickel-dependent lactate racemase